jgi:hypothetical protein
MLRIEQRNAATPVERKPDWIKAKVQMGPEFVQLKNLVKKEGLHTVCEEAGCPNIFECWEDKEATFLIGGSECTPPLRLLPDRHRQTLPRGQVRTHQGGPLRPGNAAALRHRHRSGP